MTEIAWNQSLTSQVSNSNNTEEVTNNEDKEYKSDTPNDSGLGLDASSSSYFNTLRRPRKIAGGGVLQYPIDLDTDIQDYFEIQIFKYRAAKQLPRINVETENTVSGIYSRSNRRGLRQNLRLQDLQSTIQLPIPNSVKDQNAVGWGGGEMSGVAGTLLGPVTEALFGQAGTTEKQDKDLKGIMKEFDDAVIGAQEALDRIGTSFSGITDVAGEKAIRRRNQLKMINKLTSAVGINVNVNQAISRFGAVENPNLELLITGPALRSFSFTIRLTPRSPEESRKVRMIIRALKQGMAIKKGQQLFEGGSRGLLLGTPDVFKLRYIKARTQKDIKGLNKFKTCALQNMSVDYTGEAGRFAAYDDDSQPVTSIITLSFSELVPIYDTDYVEFDLEQDNVGL
jgi:hypothetical protein